MCACPQTLAKISAGLLGNAPVLLMKNGTCAARCMFLGFSGSWAADTHSINLKGTRINQRAPTGSSATPEAGSAPTESKAAQSRGGLRAAPRLGNSTGGPARPHLHQTRSAGRQPHTRYAVQSVSPPAHALAPSAEWRGPVLFKKTFQLG